MRPLGQHGNVSALFQKTSASGVENDSTSERQEIPNKSPCHGVMARGLISNTTNILRI